MSITGIILAAVIVGGTGLFIGIFLGLADKKFAVEIDEREEQILGVLPGNNCGGCGYPGCSGLAAAIAAGEAPVNACPVGGAPVAAKVGEIMGVDAGEQVKEVRLSANLGDHPVAMVPGPGMSFEMEKYMKRVNPEMAFPVDRILELNPEHPLVKAMEGAMTENPEKAKDYANLLCCQAQLMAELPLEDPVAYTDLVCRLVQG